MRLVLVHGCGTNHRFWDTLAAEIGDDFEITALPLPGREDSDPAPMTTAADAAEWLRTRLQQLDIRGAIVLGHSYGGAIAIELALMDLAAAPLLAGLVLVATGARLRVAAPILEAVRAAVTLGVPSELGRFTYLPSTAPALVERVEAHGRRTPVASTLADWLATDGFDRLHDVAAIRTPTLVVSGTEDSLTPPKYADYLARMIPGARLERIAGAGHMLPVEHARELARLLRDFSTRA